jgi:hypothetical protein
MIDVGNSLVGISNSLVDVSKIMIALSNSLVDVSKIMVALSKIMIDVSKIMIDVFRRKTRPIIRNIQTNPRIGRIFRRTIAIFPRIVGLLRRLKAFDLVQSPRLSVLLLTGKPAEYANEDNGHFFKRSLLASGRKLCRPQTD